MLKFDGAWRFDTSPGGVPADVVNDFVELIGKVATQGDRQEILEHFKRYFASAAGTTVSWSSSVSWAETDLQSHMEQAAANAPLFIEAFYDACEVLQNLLEESLPMLSMILSNLLAKSPRKGTVRRFWSTSSGTSPRRQAQQ